eukprot:Pgem_evm1s2295
MEKLMRKLQAKEREMIKELRKEEQVLIPHTDIEEQEEDLQKVINEKHLYRQEQWEMRKRYLERETENSTRNEVIFKKKSNN